jgi:thioredoxin reductase (NADPH)
MRSYVLFAYLAPLALLWAVYALAMRKNERRAASAYASSVADGLTEPASLHPVIDAGRCLGCGACVRACPEGQVIGLINGKAQLVEGANCIGHGACKEACPFDAISLVFGTETRGVDIPDVGGDFQTNVAGIFIAGELGGMGLIRNAIEQGRQAVDAVVPLARQRAHTACDLIIVGAGPAGLAAGLAAKAAGLRFIILEQETFGGTVAHFPRGKIVMTQPIELPLVGKMRFREVAKETLLAFWADVLQRHPLPISYGERVERITAGSADFTVVTAAGARQSATILLAIGRRGTPRKLDVPGEEQSKVVYRLADPAQYRGKHVLVVGGGDSALEAAAEIAEEPDTHVTLSYRSDAFSRAKVKNRKRIETAANRGKIDVRLSSQVKSIGSDAVELQSKGGAREFLANDAVIVCAGGVLPTAFLKSIGIRMETKHGTL